LQPFSDPVSRRSFWDPAGVSKVLGRTGLSKQSLSAPPGNGDVLGPGGDSLQEVKK